MAAPPSPKPLRRTFHTTFVTEAPLTTVLVVHERTRQPSTQDRTRWDAFWRVTLQRNGQQSEACLPERQAQALVKSQVKRGQPEPLYVIERVSARISVHGVPAPDQVRRYVYWRGFSQPSHMLESDLGLP